MRRMIRMFPVIVLCFPLFAAWQAHASDQSLPHTDEVIKKFIQRSKDEDQEKRDEKYGFIEHRIHDEFDKNDKVKEHRDETFRLVKLEGHRFERKIAKDGKPLSADEQNKQVEREKKFLADERKKGADSKKNGGDSDSLNLDERFISLFKFDVVGREALEGRTSYVVTVLPRASNLPVRNNREKIFTHLQGKVWVDAQDYSFVKCDLHLTEPTSFYGVLGSLRQLDLLLQRRWVENKVWLPEKINFSLDGRKLFTLMHVRQESEYSDFKKIAE